MADPRWGTSYATPPGIISFISFRKDFAKEKRLAQFSLVLEPPLGNPGYATDSRSYK